MKMIILVLATVFVASGHALGTNFGSYDCNKPINGSFPKLMLVADQNILDLQSKGVTNLLIQIETKFSNGQTESFILPTLADNSLVAAVPLLGRVQTASPEVEYRITKQFNLEVSPGLPSTVETSTGWLKTSKENLCIASGIKPVSLSWDMNDAFASEMKLIISLEVDYVFEGSDLQYSSKPIGIAGQRGVSSLFVVGESAKTLRFNYVLTYLNKAGRVVRVGPQAMELPIPQN